jgi:hypothetical protein
MAGTLSAFALIAVCFGMTSCCALLVARLWRLSR